MAARAMPFIERELLDPGGLSLHKRVESRGFTVDTVSSPGTRVPHRHPGIELVLVHSGAAVWWVGEWLRVAAPGDLVVFDAQVLHGSRPVEGRYIRTTIHCVPRAIDPELTRWLAAIPSLPCRISLDEAKIPRVFEAVCRLRECQKAGGGLPEARLALEAIFEEAVSSAQAAERKRHPVVERVIQYMIEQTESGETIEALARRFYVSEGHLHYLFQAHFGCSPARVWRAIKIERACRELCRMNERSVDELAASAGFASRRGFQRAFKRVTGMSVEDFRSRIEALAR